MRYCEDTKNFITSKITGMSWTRIPVSLKEFWAREYRKILIENRYKTK